MHFNVIEFVQYLIANNLNLLIIKIFINELFNINWALTMQNNRLGYDFL